MGQIVPEGRVIRRPVISDPEDRRKGEDRNGERRQTPVVWDQEKFDALPSEVASQFAGKRQQGSNRRVASKDPREGSPITRRKNDRERRRNQKDRRAQVLADLQSTKVVQRSIDVSASEGVGTVVIAPNTSLRDIPSREPDKRTPDDVRRINLPKKFKDRPKLGHDAATYEAKRLEKVEVPIEQISPIFNGQVWKDKVTKFINWFKKPFNKEEQIVNIHDNENY